MAIMNELQSDYFEIERKVLRACGISLEEREGRKYKIWSYAFMFLFPYSYCLLSISEFFKEHDFEDFCVTLAYIGALFLDLAKVTVFLLNRKDIGIILNHIQIGIFAANYERGGETEKNLIKSCVNFNKAQRKGYLVGVSATIMGSVTNALLKRLRSSDPHEWDLGFGSFNVINITKSPNFELTMVYQDISFLFVACTFVTTDLIFVGILSHLSTQFQIVQNNLKWVVKNSKKRTYKKYDISYISIDDSLIYKQQLRQTMKEVVAHHLSIVDMANKVETIFRPYLLIVYLLNMIILCFGVYMALVLTDSLKRFAFIAGQVCIGIQLFVICYWCDRMTTESKNVGNAAYEAEFVGSHLNIQRDLVFIMRRSTKPSVMTAGKFFNISLPSFLKILQAAYSFLMIIHKKKLEMLR